MQRRMCHEPHPSGGPRWSIGEGWDIFSPPHLSLFLGWRDFFGEGANLESGGPAWHKLPARDNKGEKTKFMRVGEEQVWRGETEALRGKKAPMLSLKEGQTSGSCLHLYGDTRGG